MIAVDVLGGDYAPDSIIQGALRAAQTNQPVMLFGPEPLVRAKLDSFDASWRQHTIAIHHAPQLIGMAENPVSSIRKKRESSMVQAVLSAKGQQCSAVVSAGNSGAFMAAATFLLGRQPEIDRPAIGGLLPGVNGPVVGLDLGANVSCRPEHLLQFAHLGYQYGLQTLGKQDIKIGLLANGEEDEKGSELTKQTFALLKQSSLPFVGNVEPHDVLFNKIDVVVCDGFTGNIFLKTIESMMNLFTKRVKNSELSSMLLQTGYAKGGAELLGVNGRVIVCHGNSDAATIERAILFAASRSNDCTV